MTAESPLSATRRKNISKKKNLTSTKVPCEIFRKFCATSRDYGEKILILSSDLTNKSGLHGLMVRKAIYLANGFCAETGQRTETSIFFTRLLAKKLGTLW